MNDPEEIVIDQELSECINDIADKLVKQHCPKSVDPSDVAQQVMMDLARNPLKFDPSKGAKKETFLHTIVFRRVLKCAADAGKNASRFKQFPEKRPPEFMQANAKRLKFEEVLEALDDEASRELCRLYVAHNGNVSSVARELKVTEGTVRHRIETLGPRLIKAGFGKEDLSSNERDDL